MSVKNVFMRFLLVVLMLVVLVVLFTGCIRPYKEELLVEISPSQTAFLIPLEGQTSDQGVFESESLLEQSKVPTKRVIIPQRWHQKGRGNWNGEWIQQAKLIIVERKPETREWTSDASTGTSTVNQGILAESRESISFYVGMNAAAEINERDAVRFLYRYNDKPLSEVMDTEIRARIEARFVEEASKRTMEEIITDKEGIINAVHEDVIPYFKSRGISITVLGLRGDITYLDSTIQDAINASFREQRLFEAQKITNENNIAKAEAQKRVSITQAQAEAEAIKLIQEQIAKSPDYVNYVKWNKWDGELPRVMSGEGGLILDVGSH